MKLSQAVTFLALLACLTSSARAQTKASSQPAIKSADAATQSVALASADVVKVYRKEKRVLQYVIAHDVLPTFGNCVPDSLNGIGHIKHTRPRS